MRKLLGLFAVCSVVLACDTRGHRSLTAPFSAELGTYPLQSVDGKPLPVQLVASAPNTTRQLLADTLILTSGGNAREVYYVSTTTPPAAPVIGSVAVAGKYTITRDSLTMPVDFGYRYGKYLSGTIALTDIYGSVYLFAKR